MTAGTADAEVGYVYAFPGGGEIPDYNKQLKNLRYEITGAEALGFGFDIGKKTGQLRYKGRAIPEHITQVRINFTGSDAAARRRRCRATGS